MEPKSELSHDHEFHPRYEVADAKILEAVKSLSSATELIGKAIKSPDQAQLLIEKYNEKIELAFEFFQSLVDQKNARSEEVHMGRVATASHALNSLQYERKKMDVMLADPSSEIHSHIQNLDEMNKYDSEKITEMRIELRKGLGLDAE